MITTTLGPADSLGSLGLKDVDAVTASVESGKLIVSVHSKDDIAQLEDSLDESTNEEPDSTRKRFLRSSEEPDPELGFASPMLPITRSSRFEEDLTEKANYLGHKKSGCCGAGFECY